MRGGAGEGSGADAAPGKRGDRVRLWTLVNRTEQAIAGPLLETVLQADERAFDLVAGREITGPRLHADLPPRGIGCFVIGTPAALGRDFERFLRTRAGVHARADFSTAPPLRPTRSIPPPRVRVRPSPQVPAGMVEIPAASFEMTTVMRNRECGFYDSAPPGNLEFGRLDGPWREFRRTVRCARFAIDETPVTNAQFARFLRESGWRPRHAHNFLHHWIDGEPPVGLEDHPVVWVDLDDARAYARWAGKRLPTEEEWQYAAQGTDGRRYPWGDTMRSGCCNAGETGGTTPVRAFPDGRSPFGCFDLCGNTWEWTESERTDGATRFCILRGGSFFRATTSNWYVDSGPQPVNVATKFLRTWAGLDRCATVGFRCVGER